MYMKDNKVKKTELKIPAENIKKALKKSWTLYKKIWISCIVFFVIAILFAVGAKVVGSDDFKSKTVLKMIPETIETNTVDNQKMVFYKESNPDHDGNPEISLDNLLKMYKYYYLDEDGNKVYLDNGFYEYKDNSGQNQLIIVGLGFIMTALGKIETIKKALQITAVVIFVSAVVAGIVVWYIKDKKYHEQQKKPIVHKKKKN